MNHFNYLVRMEITWGQDFSSTLYIDQNIQLITLYLSLLKYKDEQLPPLSF